jgi:hypothetical protein
MKNAWEDEKCVVFVRKLKETGNFEETGVNGNKILI